MFFFASPYWISVDFKILVHSIYLIWLSGSYNIPSFFLGLPKASKFWTILKRFFCNLLHIQTEGPIVFSRSAKIPWQKSGKKWGNEHQSIFKWILFSKNVLALQFSAKKSKQTDFFSCWLKYFFTASLFVTRALKCHPVEGFSWKFSLDSPSLLTIHKPYFSATRMCDVAENPSRQRFTGKMIVLLLACAFIDEPFRCSLLIGFIYNQFCFSPKQRFAQFGDSQVCASAQHNLPCFSIWPKGSLRIRGIKDG